MTSTPKIGGEIDATLDGKHGVERVLGARGIGRVQAAAAVAAAHALGSQGGQQYALLSQNPGSP